MRLIDADTVDNYIVGHVNLKDVPTVDAFPMSVIEDIKAEIAKNTERYTLARETYYMGTVEWSERLIKESEVIEIIDKHINGKESDE